MEISAARMRDSKNDCEHNRDYGSNGMLLHSTLDVERSAFASSDL
jgi:hypothetical protein